MLHTNGRVKKLENNSWKIYFIRLSSRSSSSVTVLSSVLETSSELLEIVAFIVGDDFGRLSVVLLETSTITFSAEESVVFVVRFISVLEFDVSTIV